MPKRTLYVSRPLLHADELMTWAKAQGFGKTLTADDMHVTVAFSRAAVEWDGLAADAAPVTVIGGERAVKPLGDKGAVVLRFESARLGDRWQQLRDAGASWDWPGYQPHVTISYAGSDVDLDKVAPYEGALVFGPEKFATVDENWTDKVVEKTTPTLHDDERFTPADQLPAGLYERAKALAAAMLDVEGFTVPWLAGRSLDGSAFYPDAHLPLDVDAGTARVKTRRSVKIHEAAELICMDEGGTYDEDSDPPGHAHYHANGCEKLEVEAQGGQWAPYCIAFRPLIKETDDPALTRLPPADRWDRRPYEDDDPVLADEIDVAEAAAGKSTFAAPASATSGLAGYELDGAPPTSPRRKRRKRKAAAGPVTKESDMDALKLFFPITKIDAAKRLVYGVATAEKPDVAKEICDYASTKPLYQAWSDGFAKTTDGKSLGNLRAMHGNIAAGKITQIAFNDEARQIEVCGKVVDDAEWAKVEEGVYTGFSQGGRYVKRWPDPADSKLTRYTAEPLEVSLVDSPCLPDATFSVIKADGSTELRKFKPVAQGAAAAAAPANSEDGDWEQVWVSKRLPGQEFKTKAALRQALINLDEREVAQKAATPVLDALGAIKDTLAKAEGNEAITTAHIETVKTFMAANVGHELTARARAVFAKGDPNQTAELRKELREIIAAMEAKVAPQQAGEVAKKDYSDDERKKMATAGTAMKDGSYPIANKADLENAISAFGRAKNKAATKRHIIKRAKALKATDLLPADWPGSTKDKESKKSAGDGELNKGADLWSISDLLLLLDGVSRMEENAELPSFSFGNSVDLPKDLCDRFGAALVELGDIAAEMLDAVLSSMKDEEAGEAVANAVRASDLQKLALAKVGAKHAKADKEKIKQAHDLLTDLDPDCCPAGDDENADDGDAEKLAKQLAAAREANGRLLNETILPLIKGLATQLADVGKSVKTLADQPLPMGASSVTLRVVEKTQDGAANQPARSIEALAELADRALAEARAGKIA